MDIKDLFLLFLLFGFSFFYYKYFLLILNKYKPNLLMDDQFTKPQAFHESATSTAGGIYIFFSLLITYFYFLLSKNILFIEYISFCALFFILGFLDDIKININPKIRLFLMIIFLIMSKSDQNLIRFAIHLPQTRPS